jgi:crotonobetainyl-CoA:carnitine CoA-transferase CaiB-like acyl-CoA transferase
MPLSPPLAGIRVLELGSTVAGPAACRLLADLGADVYKIEPGEGDQLRTWGVISPDGTGWWFKSHNRNKRLLTFDLKNAEHVATIQKMALACDVIVENFRPGYLARIALDAETLREKKPELVYLSISGYGQTGPYADRPGYGSIAEAMGGLRYITGESDGPPMRMGISIGDEIAALYSVIGVLAALRGRDRDKVGETIDVSLIESTYSVLEGALPDYVHGGTVARRAGNRLSSSAPSNVYPTKDGEWLAIGANGQSIFRRFTAAIGHPELADDERFATNQGRLRNIVELDELIAAWTEQYDLAEADAIMANAGVPAGPVMSIEQIVANPQFAARGAVQHVRDDDGTDIATYASPIRFTERDIVYDRAAGAIGRDQAEALEELIPHVIPSAVEEQRKR